MRKLYKWWSIFYVLSIPSTEEGSEKGGKGACRTETVRAFGHESYRSRMKVWTESEAENSKFEVSAHANQISCIDSYLSMWFHAPSSIRSSNHLNGRSEYGRSGSINLVTENVWSCSALFLILVYISGFLVLRQLAGNARQNVTNVDSFRIIGCTRPITLQG